MQYNVIIICEGGNTMWGDIAIAFLLGLITAFVVTPFSMRIAKK